MSYVLCLMSYVLCPMALYLYVGKVIQSFYKSFQWSHSRLISFLFCQWESKRQKPKWKLTNDKRQMTKDKWQKRARRRKQTKYPKRTMKEKTCDNKRKTCRNNKEGGKRGKSGKKVRRISFFFFQIETFVRFCNKRKEKSNFISNFLLLRFCQRSFISISHFGLSFWYRMKILVGKGFGLES